MKWFEGKIPDAIQKSKQNKVVFVVYIYGQDELSTKMSAIWENEAVTSVCEANRCVAIKLASNSAECGHFSQIYPVVVVPSTYFIGMNGVPIEVTPGGVDEESFLTTLTNVIKVHEEQKAANPSSPSSNQQMRGGGVSSPTSQSAASNAEAPPLQERVERAKQLMQQKKEDKERATEEDQRNKEMERRKLGQDLQKLKQYQAEREQKETMEQLKKDRAEEKRQRELIKEQIARDREERAARFKKEKQEQEKAKEEAKKAKLLAQQEAASVAEARRSETARIQVRLPDGSSITDSFPSTDSLHRVYSFVTQTTGSPVTLSQVFPKRQFTEEDMDKSLLSLDLAPSAVIMALPRSGGGRTSGPVDSGGGLLAVLLAPFMWIWNLLSTFLFGGASSSAPPSSSAQEQENNSSSGARPKSAYQRRPASRADGNMRRLTDYRDDDDENATWNGNSTQQM